MSELFLLNSDYYLRGKNRFYFRNPDTKKKVISFELFGEDFDRTKKVLVKGRSYTLRYAVN